MYKTLENYSTKNPHGNSPFVTNQRDIAQQNRQLQALQHNGRQYSNDVARGNIAPNTKLHVPSLQYLPKNSKCTLSS